MGNSDLEKKVNVANHPRHQFLLCASPELIIKDKKFGILQLKANVNIRR